MNGEKTWLSIYPDHIMREIEIPNIPLDQILKESSNKYPGNPAISFYSQTWTYNELESRVDSFASALQQAGVNKGNRVAIMLPNCPQFVVCYYGSLRAGATVVQVNPLLVGRELQHILADSGTETIVVLDKLYEHVKEAEKSTRLKNIVVVSLQDTQHDCSPNDTYDSFLQKSTGQVKPITIDPYEDVAVLQYTGGHHRALERSHVDAPQPGWQCGAIYRIPQRQSH